MEAILRIVCTEATRWRVRRHERMAVSQDLPLVFTNLNAPIEGKILNIGRGGMFVALTGEQLPEVGAHACFDMIFEVEGSLTVSGEGDVRWVRRSNGSEGPAGCGIEFTYLTDECRIKLNELIRRNGGKAFIPRK